MDSDEKRAAGLAAADEVESGMALGLGTGSTVYFFLEELGRRVQRGLKVVGIPTSERTAQLARRFGIPLTSFNERQNLDLAVDGADEVDPSLCLIKGQGGALLREKIIALASNRRIIVVDSGKLSPKLGSRSTLPVEVVPFAWKLAERELREVTGAATLRVISKDDPDMTESPYVTDNGNYILDCELRSPEDVARLESDINRLPGVLENGLFVSLADEVIVGRGTKVERLTR